jgi:hypothetical protein
LVKSSLAASKLPFSDSRSSFHGVASSHTASGTVPADFEALDEPFLAAALLLPRLRRAADTESTALPPFWRFFRGTAELGLDSFLAFFLAGGEAAT